MPSILEIRNSLGLGSSLIHASQHRSSLQVPGYHHGPCAQNIPPLEIVLVVRSSPRPYSLQGCHHQQKFISSTQHHQSVHRTPRPPAEEKAENLLWAQPARQGESVHRVALHCVYSSYPTSSALSTLCWSPVRFVEHAAGPTFSCTYPAPPAAMPGSVLRLTQPPSHIAPATRACAGKEIVPRSCALAHPRYGNPGLQPGRSLPPSCAYSSVTAFQSSPSSRYPCQPTAFGCSLGPP